MRDEYLDGIMKRTPKEDKPTPPSGSHEGTLIAKGISRLADAGRTLGIAFSRRPTDDEMRKIHDLLRDPAALSAREHDARLAKRLDAYFAEWSPRMRSGDKEYGEGDWSWLAQHLRDIAVASMEHELSPELQARKEAAIRALQASPSPEPNAAPQERRAGEDGLSIRDAGQRVMSPAVAAPSALAEEIERALNVLAPLCTTDYLFTAPNAAPNCELRISTLRKAIAALKARA